MINLNDKYALINKENGKISLASSRCTAEEIEKNNKTKDFMNQMKTSLFNISDILEKTGFDMKDILVRVRFKPFIKSNMVFKIYDSRNQEIMNKSLGYALSKKEHDKAFETIDRFIYPNAIMANIDFGVKYDSNVFKGIATFEDQSISGIVDGNELFKFINFISKDFNICNNTDSISLNKGQMKDITKGLILESVYNGEEENFITSTVDCKTAKRLNGKHFKDEKEKAI